MQSKTSKVQSRKAKQQAAKKPITRRPRQWTGPLVIVLAGAAAYASSFGGQFIMDDQIGILANPRIHSLFPLKKFFDDTRPVADFTLALNYAACGLNRPAFHAVNLAIHLVAALALFGLVRRSLLMERFAGRFDASAAGFALAVSLLWVVHPLATQAVTYIIQRAESLMACFYLLTLYSISRAGGSPRPMVWHIAAIVSCALGMGSKAVMASAPLVAFLYDAIFMSGSARESLRRRWGLYLALGASVGILWRVGVIGGLYLKDQGNPITVGFAMEGLTAWQYALTQPGVIMHYLRLCLWPHPLCIDYGWPVAKTVSQILPGAIVVGALFAATCWALWKRPVMGFVGAAFFLILAPTSSIVPIKDIAFEHRMYLPLAALLVALVASGDWMLRSLSASQTIQPATCSLVARGLVGMSAAALALATFSRNALYAQPVELWRQNVALTPANSRPVNALGYSRFKAGRYDEALVALRRAIELDPLYAGAYANIGLLYWTQGNAVESVKYFGKAVDISPFEFGAELYNPYGLALLATGQKDEAIKALNNAVECDPDNLDARYNLGNAYYSRGLSEKAVEAYREVLRQNPRYVEAHINLGMALAGLGDADKAAESYRRALALSAARGSPDIAFKAHYNLGLLLLRRGQKADARKELTEALRIMPAHKGAQSALADASSL